MFKIICKDKGKGINEIYNTMTAETIEQARDLYKNAVDRFLADYSDGFDIPLSLLLTDRDNDEYDYRYTYGPKAFSFVSYDCFDRCVTTIRIVEA